MESTSQKGNKDKWPTKVSASARRKNAAENPPKKQSRKRPAQPEVAETAHPGAVAAETGHVEAEHHEGDPTQAKHHQAEDMEED
ncbi:hypothetical protein A2U01_0078433, partial [Trifolium medium]|nr:hypothetical protein [Trifolium medium]